MFRVVTSASSTALSRHRLSTAALLKRVRSKSTTTSDKPLMTHPLHADTGSMGSHIHHTLAHSMAILAPLYMLIPDSKTEGWMHRTFGVLLGANMGMHAWIGLNFVTSDYVPKIHKALLPPVRYLNAFCGIAILLGMAKISIWSPGGIKGVAKGVWNGKRKDGKFEF